MDQKHSDQTLRTAEGFLLNNFLLQKCSMRNERANTTNTIEIINFDCIIKNLKIFPRSISSSFISEERKFSVVLSVIF